MTRPHAEHDVARRPQIPPEFTPRLRLKPKASHAGFVDGAWWPRSDDLITELPDLLAVLSVRLGVIDRVIYNVSEWATAPRKLATGGRVVRLGAYTRQPVNTLEVLGVNRNKIVLLVVPPRTDPDDAYATMTTAAGRDNDSTVDGLLMITAEDRQTRTRRASIEERWNSRRRAKG